MTVAAYRDRSSGAYPITADQVRARSMMLYGQDPPPAALVQANVEPVEAVAPPSYDATKQTVSEGLPVKQNGVWVQTWVVQALPAPPPAITYKADVWRRATSEQAAIIDTELTKLDVRMRRLWDDASYLDHSTPEFDLLRGTMLTAFGEEETDRILAPSNV